MRFEHTVGRSYEDVGGGQVLHSAPGFPGFPPRALEGLPNAADRVSSVDRLLRMAERTPPPPMETGLADITDRVSVARLNLTGIDVVMADLPYGRQTEWEAGSEAPAAHALEVLSGRLRIGSVVVFISTERHRFRELPQSSRSFKHGHRHIRMYRVD